MALTVLSLIAFFALVAWSFVFTGLRRRSLAREIAAPEEQHKNALERGLHILDLAGTAVIPDNPFENTSDDVRGFNRKDRAKTYLRRIVALTGATRMGNHYLLDVGTTRFHVRDRYVGRLRAAANPNCTYEETCYYSVHKEIPKAEQVAAALLQLKNNPALFDRWAAQTRAVKAEGQAFSPAQ